MACVEFIHRLSLSFSSHPPHFPPKRIKQPNNRFSAHQQSAIKVFDSSIIITGPFFLFFTVKENRRSEKGKKIVREPNATQPSSCKLLVSLYMHFYINIKLEVLVSLRQSSVRKETCVRQLIYLYN